MSGCLRYCGRDFPAAELDLIRALIAQRDPPLFRTALSRAVCAALDWRKPDGGLKEMSARVALLRMQRDGLLTLPPPLRTVPRPQPLAAVPVGWLRSGGQLRVRQRVATPKRAAPWWRRGPGEVKATSSSSSPLFAFSSAVSK